MVDDRRPEELHVELCIDQCRAADPSDFLELRTLKLDSPDFVAEARRQSLLVANSPFAKDDQDFVDSISVFWDEGWDEDWNFEDAP